MSVQNLRQDPYFQKQEYATSFKIRQGQFIDLRGKQDQYNPQNYMVNQKSIKNGQAELELAHESYLIHGQQKMGAGNQQKQNFQGLRAAWPNIGVEGDQSFDADMYMPPDINSIDADINKIGALTPSEPWNFKF